MNVLIFPRLVSVILTVLALSSPAVIADSQLAFDECREMKWKDGRRPKETASVISLDR